MADASNLGWIEYVLHNNIATQFSWVHVYSLDQYSHTYTHTHIYIYDDINLTVI